MKKTLTICIPAFNEAENLKKLLPALLGQKRSAYNLLQILIASDASTDAIPEVIKKLSNKKIVVIYGKERKGVGFRQNQLLSHANSEIVVLLNADILITDKNYIEKLIAPIVKNQADLTSSTLEETLPRTFFEKAIYFSMQAKKYVFSKFKDGHNVYTCRGPARAFNKKLYKSIRFPSGIGEDAYSYLFAIQNGFRFRAVRNASAYYTLPSGYKDHKRQSIRFLRSKSGLESKFGQELMQQEYNIPLKYILEAAIIYTFKQPVFMIWYGLIFGWIKIRALFKSVQSETWEVVSSSKLLNI